MALGKRPAWQHMEELRDNRRLCEQLSDWDDRDPY